MIATAVTIGVIIGVVGLLYYISGILEKRP